jgi:pimeloyl-ACP methyl ester carboxylesterase
MAYKEIKNAELCVVPGAGHFVNEETPAVFNQVVMDFFRRKAMTHQSQ